MLPAIDLECPTCLAAPGVACRGRGVPASGHKSRQEAAQREGLRLEREAEAEAALEALETAQAEDRAQARADSRSARTLERRAHRALQSLGTTTTNLDARAPRLDLLALNPGERQALLAFLRETVDLAEQATQAMRRLDQAIPEIGEDVLARLETPHAAPTRPEPRTRVTASGATLRLLA